MTSQCDYHNEKRASTVDTESKECNLLCLRDFGAPLRQLYRAVGLINQASHYAIYKPSNRTSKLLTFPTTSMSLHEWQAGQPANIDRREWC